MSPSPTSTLDDMAEVFDALGHPTRRQILDLLRDQPGMSVGALARHFDTTRVGVMHHLRILEDAALVISMKEGRVRQLFHNPVPIQLIYDRWTTEYGSFWGSKMADVKYAVEHPQPTQTGRTDGGHGSAGLARGDSRKDRGRVA